MDFRELRCSQKHPQILSVVLLVDLLIVVGGVRRLFSALDSSPALLAGIEKRPHVQEKLYLLTPHDMATCIVPCSSLEDRISDLCAQAATAKTQAELEIILPQLRAAFRDQIAYLRAIAVEAIPHAFGRDSNAAD